MVSVETLTIARLWINENQSDQEINEKPIAAGHGQTGNLLSYIDRNNNQYVSNWLLNQ